MSQLSLFDEPVIVNEVKESFWKRHFNWDVEVGKPATINTTIAFNQRMSRNYYCYMMRVNVISISEEMAICETTECWEAACRNAHQNAPIENWHNNAGEIWHVPLNQLSPILKILNQ